MEPFDFQPRTRVIFGRGALEQLGPVAREHGLRRPLLVADRGLVAAGHVESAATLLRRAGIDVVTFHDFDVNPDTSRIEAGRAFSAPLGIDSLIGFGGGSSLDCAKGINFLLTNGGDMRDYHGYGKATRPMLPMIGVPTTAGTGSEAQSYAVVSDAATRVKMACGDPKAAFRVAILDPDLTISQPAPVTAAAGFDAIAHAVETYVTTKRNGFSTCFSREAWRLLSANYGRVVAQPDDVDARGAMHLGAHYAGLAIEHSMLGAAHACANPLTARYDITHGIALAILLPHVVRWNASIVQELYSDLLTVAAGGPSDGNPGGKLAAKLAELGAAAGLPDTLRAAGVQESDLETLAKDATEQWTGMFNPRPLDADSALEVYTCAY